MAQERVDSSSGAEQQQADVGWRVGRVWASAVLFAVFVGAIIARWLLFATGRLAGQDLEFAANVLVALLAIFAVGLVFGARRRVVQEPGVGAVIGAVAIAIGLPVAAIGLTQALAPSTPREASAPACRGASVAGGKLLTTTGDIGVNARKGPGTTYAPNRRFGANCTLSFDGYCIGEPINDLVVTDLPDQRWLILHRSLLEREDALVAAAKVLSQDAESKLGDQPDERCSNLGGLPVPARVKLKAQLRDDKLMISAASSRALLIGFAVDLGALPSTGGDDRFVALGDAPKKTDPQGATTATWNVAFSGKAVGHSTRMTLLSTVCLAPAVPLVGAGQAVAVEWDGRRATLLPGAVVPNSQDAQRLRAAACRVAPDRIPPPLHR